MKNRRIRAARYKGLFTKHPAKGELFTDEIMPHSSEEKLHRLARQGKASNFYLARVESFFGYTDRAAGYLRP